jgi:transcriptional regulator
MYTPALFRETDKAKLHAFMEEHSFATLISQGGEGLVGSHLPVLLDRDAGPFGGLFGHMARANSHWRQTQGEALVVFSGPHAYISPTWYEADDAVPTWNYVAVHAYGTLEVVDDPEALREILRRSVAVFEGSMPRPWVFDESDESVQTRLKSIVGFRIAISRLEGKWKLSQNRPEVERERVVQVLSDRTDDDSRAIARLMDERP